MAIRPFDAGYESAGHLDDTAPLIERGDYTPPTERPVVVQPTPSLLTLAPSTPQPVVTPAHGTKATTAAIVKPKPALKPRPKPKPVVKKPPVKTHASAPKTYSRIMTGLASWYDNGTTAMRLPRGTHIKICGARSCVTTVTRDWGPARYLSKRIVDMTPGDFVRVTGKSLGAGLASVKVYIY